LVLRRYIQNAVRVDIKRHLDLRQATGCRRYIGQVEAAQRFVVTGAFALTLQDVNRYRGLVVVRGRENLLGVRRNRGVLLDQLGHDTAERLDAERERGDVQQQDVLDVAREDSTLDRRTQCDGFVGVHVATRLLAEEVLHLFLDLRHARLAADQDDVVDFVDLEAGILERHLARPDGAVNQLVDQRLELGPGQLDIEVLRPGRVRGDVRKVHFRLLRGGQLDLRLFRSFFQALHRERVLRD